MAGSYDLLVPLMLTEAVAMIALRKVNLYPGQPRTMKDSPIHATLLARLRCGDVASTGRATILLHLGDPLAAAAHMIESANDQDVFPVLDEQDRVVGLLSAEAMRGLFAHEDALAAGVVADVMVEPLIFHAMDSVRGAAIMLANRDLRAAPIVDDAGRVIAMLDQHDIVKAITAAPGPGETLQ